MRAEFIDLMQALAAFFVTFGVGICFGGLAELRKSEKRLRRLFAVLRQAQDGWKASNDLLEELSGARRLRQHPSPPPPQGNN